MPISSHSEEAILSVLKNQYSDSILMGDAKRRCISNRDFETRLINEEDRYSRISIEELTKTNIDLGKTQTSIEDRCEKEELRANSGLESIMDQDVCVGMVRL